MNRLKWLIVVSGLFIISGCAMKWQPALDTANADTPSSQSQTRLAAADECFNRSGNAANLKACKDGYLAVLDVNAGDYAALTKLSTINILLGTAYTIDSKSKSEHFRRAMHFAEQAMYTNANFRSAVRSGRPLWQAVDRLGKDEVEAMFFWVTALQYEFKEGMSLPAKIVNLEWLQYSLSVLERIEEVAPDFGGGGVEFAKVICYYVLPKRMGGSKQRGDELMHAAVARNDGWLLPRWARGKYYYKMTGQPEKMRQDLMWVASQDPADYHDPYPWRLFFQEDSAQLLK